ncbi:MAG: hypothetical protein D6771_02785, partial [Zetaproteobacteria bacterium]
MASFLDFIPARRTPSRAHPTGERSKKMRLILLAIQMLALKRGWRGRSIPARICVADLARLYLEERLSATEAGAAKMAKRDLEEIRKVFGLRGDEQHGYMLGMDFPPPHAYLKMFRHWLDALRRQPTPHDEKLAMMLEGLIVAIESAFTNDPICIPALARQLRARYGKRNLREPMRALRELFDERAMASFLPWEHLDAEEPDTRKVDTSLDPLLLRRRPREAVGDNVDATQVLARPGHVSPALHAFLQALPPDRSAKMRRLAEAVCALELWRSQDGKRAAPFSLNMEPEEREKAVLVVFWLDEGAYEEIPTDRIRRWPERAPAYVPDGVPEALWTRWKSLAGWQ